MPPRLTPGDGGAVIGVPAADEDLALRLALELPVVAHQAEDRVVGLGAGRIVEDVAEVAAHLLGDLGGQQHRGRRRRLEEGVVVGQLQHLVVGGLGQLGPAVADIDAPEPRHAVEDRVPLPVIDGRALGAGDDAAAALLGDDLVVGLGGQVVRQVQALQFGDVIVADRGGHGSHLWDAAFVRPTGNRRAGRGRRARRRRAIGDWPPVSIRDATERPGGARRRDRPRPPRPRRRRRGPRP